MEVIKFEKSFEKRYEEYSLIFSTKEPCASSYDIKAVWSDYLESSIEPIGWVAVWYLPKFKCFEYNVIFSSSVVVMVNSVNYASLTADVTVLNTEQNEKYDFATREIYDVPLYELFVTAEQTEPNLNFRETAECLDQLRLFFIYLWWPWDEENSCSFDNWVSEFLYSRLRLYYDLKERNYHDRVIKTVKALIEKGRILFEKIRNIPDETILEMEEKGLMCNNQAVDVIEAVNALEYCRDELLRFTKPNMLKMLHLDATFQKIKPGGYMVLPKCSRTGTIPDYFQRASSMYPTVLFKRSVPTVKEALDSYSTNDLILLTPGAHSLTSQRLDVNVTIKGLFDDNKSTICEIAPFWYLLKTTADDITIGSVVLNIETCRTVIYVKEGVTCLDSVVMKNLGGENTKAIIVEDNATLLANGCLFYDFDVAITCLSGSAVELTDCTFDNNNVAVEIVDGAQVCLKNADASRSNRVPIKYHGNVHRKEFKPLDALDCVEALIINSVKIHDEQKAVEFV